MTKKRTRHLTRYGRLRKMTTDRVQGDMNDVMTLEGGKNRKKTKISFMMITLVKKKRNQEKEKKIIKLQLDKVKKLFIKYFV